MRLPRVLRRLPPWWRGRRARLLELWTVGVAASVLVSAASAAGYLEGTQARALDLVMRLSGDRLLSGPRLARAPRARAPPPAPGRGAGGPARSPPRSASGPTSSPASTSWVGRRAS